MCGASSVARHEPAPLRAQHTHLCRLCCHALLSNQHAAKFVVEGVDMLLFDEEGKITTLVQFNMQVRVRSTRLSRLRCARTIAQRNLQCLAADSLTKLQDYSRQLRDSAPAGGH
jgi:hypothetical protein